MQLAKLILRPNLTHPASFMMWLSLPRLQTGMHYWRLSPPLNVEMHLQLKWKRKCK